MITSIIDKDGVTQTTNRGILHTFVEFLEANMTVFRWMMRALLERRKLGIGLYRYDEETS